VQKAYRIVLMSLTAHPCGHVKLDGSVPKGGSTVATGAGLPSGRGVDVAAGVGVPGVVKSFVCVSGPCPVVTK